nr:fibronectin type III domain-containing protein [bacterium]
SELSLDMSALNQTAPSFGANKFTKINEETGYVDLNWATASSSNFGETQIVYNIYSSSFDTIPIFATMSDSTPTFLFKFGDTVVRNFYIKSEDLYGNESTDSLSVAIFSKDSIAPSQPQNLRYKIAGIDQINLSWNESTDNSKEPINYIIYKVIDSSVYNQVGKTYSNRFTYKFEMWDYYCQFAVSAVDWVGNESLKSSLLDVYLPEETDIVVDSAPPTFSGISEIISGNANYELLLQMLKPSDTGTVYIDVYRSNSNSNITQNDSVFVQTFVYNSASDTNIAENKLLYSLTGLSGTNGDSYQLIAVARDEFGNANDNFQTAQGAVSGSNSTVHHFNIIPNGFDINSLPVGKDVTFTLLAKNASDALIESLQAGAYVSIQENDGIIFGSWNSDKFADNDGFNVNIKNGVGYFSMNNSEKEQLGVKVKFGLNLFSNFTFNFTAARKGVSTTAQFALYANNTEFNANEFAEVTVFALNADGMINTAYSGFYNVTFKVIENNNDYSVKINDMTVEGNNKTFN